MPTKKKGAGSRCKMPSKPPCIGQPAKQKSRGRAWTQTSKSMREVEPLCRFCLLRGANVPAVCVDHIKPLSEGGLSIASNLQPLCKACHSRKSNIDTSQGATYGNFPIKITLVCGPPGSGKSTLVHQQLQSGDAMLDYDNLIVAMTCEQKWTEGGLAHASMIRCIRDSLITFALGGKLNGRLWVILSDISSAILLQGATPDATLILLPTPIDLCVQAIRGRRLPEARTINAKLAISNFHATFLAKRAEIDANPKIAIQVRMGGNVTTHQTTQSPIKRATSLARQPK